jgi:ADP-ribose pyrophosphatase YjhB (NUDIX family)
MSACAVPNAVTIAIIEKDSILLIQREDFRVWGLPGGDVDPGESLVQAAIREAREETGLTVELTRLVGMYSLVGNDHTLITAVFAARPASGQLSPDPHEISDIGWFRADALPEALMWWHRRRIEHAFAGVTGAVWRQEGGWPFPPGFTRGDLYAARDASGLPRAEAFRQLFPWPGPDAEVMELPGVSIPPEA